MNKYTLLYFMEKFPTEQSCREHLEKIRWNNKPVCPHCGNSQKIYRYSDGKLFKCSECGKRFQVTTGTIYQKSKISLRKFFLTSYLIAVSKKSISSIELSKAPGITQKSALYLLHKIRCAMKNAKCKQLQGVVEVDETYCGPRKPRYRGGKRGRGTSKQGIFGALQREGDVFITAVPDTKRRTLEPIIKERVKKGSTIFSDEYGVYRRLHTDYDHHTVNQGIKEYARGNVHVNSLEGAWRHFKSVLMGTYHRPSKQHLDKYCAEFAQNYNTRNDSVEVRFQKSLRLINSRVMYKDIVPRV